MAKTKRKEIKGMEVNQKLEAYLEDLKGHHYVKRVSTSNQTIVYTDDFYRDLNQKLVEGAGPIQAYNALGLDTAILGEDRAFACAKRARNKAARSGSKAQTMTPAEKYGNYDGTIPPEQMDLDSMSETEQLKYYRAREAVLSHYFDIIKKKK